ncbi:MAG: cytochrome C, partial [Acidobacteriota bacterium]|nr:cytochrome C [Acidobacteriota bacterium]
MRTLLKLAGILLVLLLVGGAAGLAYFLNRFPNASPPREVTLPSTSEAIARGEYLASHVMLCVDCHSPRDFSKFAGPIVRARLG